MVLKNAILLFSVALTFGSFSQSEERVDSNKFETKCDCLKAEYLFKKD